MRVNSKGERGRCKTKYDIYRVFNWRPLFKRRNWKIPILNDITGPYRQDFCHKLYSCYMWLINRVRMHSNMHTLITFYHWQLVHTHPPTHRVAHTHARPPHNPIYIYRVHIYNGNQPILAKYLHFIYSSHIYDLSSSYSSLFYVCFMLLIIKTRA